jgi:hypothetical protein
MDKISRAKLPDSPDQGLKNYGARQFEYAFVKRKSAPPSGKSASEFVQCVCENSYCVGSISCVGCVPQLRTELRTPPVASQLRPASSSVASVLRPVACQLRSCASPNSMLSRMFRNSRRAATAMKVQRTAERLAHIVNLHKRALSELRQLSQLSGSSLLSSSSSELRPSVSRPCELRSPELNVGELSAASPSNLRPCELRPVASPASSELRAELVKRAEPVKRESPLRKFASVVSHTASIKTVSVKSASVKSELVESGSVNSSSVALLRPPKRSLH